MGWYRDIQEILNQEPEVWLAYNQGQNLDNIPHLSKNEPRYPGLLLRLGMLLLWVLNNSRPRRSPSLKSCEKSRFLVFAFTVNQMNSLDTTVDALRDRGESVLAICRKKHLDTPERKKRYSPFNLGIIDSFIGLALLISRGPNLMRALGSKKPIAKAWYLDAFCSTYFYLGYFYGLLRKLRPEFVITANDHNEPNRCMLAVAHYLGIKTVYLQHASVGTLFPALRVNYAFLDGQSALETYRKCEQNQPEQHRRVPVPTIFLSGQKKHLYRDERLAKPFVGFAVNTLDNPEAAMQLANSLSEAGHSIRFRWHPAQSKSDIQKYKCLLSKHPKISLSDPKVETCADFMKQIHYLIAGNTGILLEAAVAGVCPIYYELQKPDIRDVYGFVQHGLAVHAKNEVELLDLIAGDKLKLNQEAVRFYSATFDTEWESKEGGLVAECLVKLADGKDATSLFGYAEFLPGSG